MTTQRTVQRLFLEALFTAGADSSDVKERFLGLAQSTGLLDDNEDLTVIVGSGSAYHLFRLAHDVLVFFASEDPGPWHFYVASETLDRELQGEDLNEGLIDLVEARRDLAASLCDSIRYLKDKIDKRIQAATVNDWERIHQIFNEAFFAHTEAIGRAGQEYARQVRIADAEDANNTDPKHLWRYWWLDAGEGEDLQSRLKGVGSFAYGLAVALWRDRVRPRLKRARQNQPALSKPVYERVLLDPVSKDRVRIVQSPDDRQAVLYLDDNPIAQTAANLPQIEFAKIFSVLTASTPKLQTVTAHKWFEYAIITSHKRWALGEQDPRSFWFEGGIAEIAEAINETASSKREEIREILQVGAHWEFRFDNGRTLTSLWTANLPPEGRGKRGHASVALSHILLPHANQDFRDKILVPVVVSPPFVGARRTFGAQAALAKALVYSMIETVEKRVQLAQEQSVLIDITEQYRLAKRVGLDEKTLRNALDRWSQDGDDGPAFLERIGKDRFNLADNSVYGDARRFMQDTVEGSANARKDGKRSAEKRQSERKKDSAGKKRK
jgi:hypothetical protein